MSVVKLRTDEKFSLLIDETPFASFGAAVPTSDKDNRQSVAEVPSAIKLGIGDELALLVDEAPLAVVPAPDAGCRQSLAEVAGYRELRINYHGPSQ